MCSLGKNRETFPQFRHVQRNYICIYMRQNGTCDVVPVHVMNACKESTSTHFTSTPDDGEWPASRPRPLYLPENSTPYSSAEKSLDSIACLDVLQRIIISCPRRESKPGSPVHGLVITWTMYIGSQCEK